GLLDRAQQLLVALLHRRPDLDAGEEREGALELVRVLLHDLVHQDEVVHRDVGAVVLEGARRRRRVRVRRDLDGGLAGRAALLALLPEGLLLYRAEDRGRPRPAAVGEALDALGVALADDARRPGRGVAHEVDGLGALRRVVDVGPDQPDL